MGKLLASLILLLVCCLHCGVSAAASPPVFSSPPAASSTTILTGQNVTFTAAATDPQGLPIIYSYDYGDGTVNSLGSHVYVLPGSYTVLVTASDCILSTTASIPLTVRGIANLWIKKQSVKVGVAGKESWQTQYIYNADRTSARVFNSATDGLTVNLGTIPGVQINAGQLVGKLPKLVFKSAKGSTPLISAALDESAQTITVSGSSETFADVVPAVFHNFVRLGANQFSLDSALDAKGKFTANSGYRSAAFVVSAGNVTIKSAGKDSAKLSLLLADPAFQFPGVSGLKTVRLLITNSSGFVVVDKDFTSIATFSGGKFTSGKDSAAAPGKFSYDSAHGKMSFNLSKATLTSLLSAPAEHVRVDVVLGDQTYTTHVTLFAPKLGLYSTKMANGSLPQPGGPGKPLTAAPTVTATSPLNGATGVALNQKVTVTFSTPMDVATINTASFTLQQGSTPVSGTVNLIGSTATFTLSANLTASTLYTATVTTAAKDIAGNALAANVPWCFTTGATVDTTAPVVLSTRPANTATGVAISTKVTATFSETMDPSTITATTFTLQQGGSPVAGAVSYTGTTATFAPAASLASNTLFTATMTTGVKDLAGNPMAGNYVWTFTTGATANSTPPTITSTNPANGAVNVTINHSANATFSKPMDASTLTTATFIVAGSDNLALAGTVSYDTTNNIVTFKPASNLASNSTFTATVTSSVKDLDGNALGADYVWSFTTGSQAAQEHIVFGSAGTFAILAGAAVTNTGPTNINGDLGVSPGTAVSGFPPGNVNGAQHAGDSAAAQAKSDLLAAYNDGAARLGAAVLPGNLGGLTFTPGLYKNSSSTGISGTGPQGILTLDAQGDPDAVFIFQMASTLITDPGTQVVLAGGAKEGNIYWQVGSSATLGTTSVFKGNILADQSITLNTGATLDGRALTRIGAVTMDSNPITRPAQ